MFGRIAGMFRREPTRAQRAAAAQAAVAAAQAELAARSPETEATAWADAQFELARALCAYGEVRPPRAVTAAESDAEHAAQLAPFLEAEASLRAALQVCTREAAPDRWADLQQELARVLRRVGEKRYEDESITRAAAEAARAALSVRTREHAPDAWLESQLELAEILFDSASNLEREPERYTAAVAAFRTAAEATADQRRSRPWAWTRYRLALVLMHAGSVSPDLADEAREAMLRESLLTAREVAAWAARARDKALRYDANGVAGYAETFLKTLASAGA